LQPGLWAGRSNGKPVGIIEHGHRYSFTDVEEQIHPGYKTLIDAQDAATGPIPIHPPTDHPTATASRRRTVTTIALIPAAAAAGAAVAGGIALAMQFLLA
jgi:hypothetical protein